MTKFEEALAETDSTAFVAMVRSKPFAAFLAAWAERMKQMEDRLVGTPLWDDACRLQGAIKVYRSMPDLLGDVEAELKKREKES